MTDSFKAPHAHCIVFGYNLSSNSLGGKEFSDDPLNPIK
jgi:hypothetical protein